MFDLLKLPAHYLSVYGREKVAEVTGQTVSIVAMWEKRSKFPLDAVAKLLDFDPAPLGEVVPLYTNPEPGMKLMILVPLSGPPQPKMMDALIRLIDKSQMSYERFGFNCLSVARSVLAARFLRSPCPWSYWLDGDTLPPAGDAGWFKEAAGLPDLPDTFAGVHSIFRALYHKKTIVSLTYIARRMGGPIQFSGGDTQDMILKVKGGPRNELIERAWAGMGGMLVHRSVFEDIIKTQGDELRMKPGGIGKRFDYEYSFFHPLDKDTPADDIPFLHRAAKAGHKTYVDLAIHAGHIGDRAYTFKDL